LAKERALEILEEGELKEAIDSMVSDYSKNPAQPEALKTLVANLGFSLRNDPGLDEDKVRNFIEGFSEGESKDDQDFDYRAAKDRALAVLERGEPEKAIDTILREIRKDPRRCRENIEANESSGMFYKAMLKAGEMTAEDIREFIESFRQ